eukprot:1158294-Prorocentrum_minimum.AAC.1
MPVRWMPQHVAKVGPNGGGMTVPCMLDMCDAAALEPQPEMFPPPLAQPVRRPAALPPQAPSPTVHR